MPFLQLTWDVERIETEALEAAALAAGALSVTLSDAGDTPILEPQPDTAPLWPSVRVSALFAADAERAAILDALEAALGRVPAAPVFCEIADRVWERECLADFRPMRFGSRLWICPAGTAVDVRDAVVVRLDPGLAFGTGTHPTTAMCLEWLDAAQLAGREVIDYGCGSGILAIAAVKLGVRHALALDHDPQALIATRENAARNGVERQVQIVAADMPLSQVDVLLANILALPLIELAPKFQTLVRRGGDLALSGILAEQTDAVVEAYRPWFEMGPPLERDGWVRLHGVRRG